MELKFILEALLFAAQQPLSVRQFKELLAETAAQAASPEAEPFRKAKEADIEAALAELAREHASAQRSFRLVSIAGSWQFVSQPEFMPWLKTFVGQKVRPPRLSQPALETLAIIAYRQPLTRAEIEQIRGVSVDGVLQTLIERGLVEQKGRAEVIGRPQTYGTTDLFLEYFGLNNLDDLPSADELRRMVVQKPEELLTADAAPATAETGASSVADEPAQNTSSGLANAPPTTEPPSSIPSEPGSSGVHAPTRLPGSPADPPEPSP